MAFRRAARLAVFLSLWTTAASAAPSCTLITDAETGAALRQDGPCGMRNSPASTFKVVLALAGFESGILIDARTPLWPYRGKYRSWDADWKKRPTDPAGWLKDSVVWYSRLLVQHMGRAGLQGFVNSFDYGNRDLTGTPGFRQELPEPVWVDDTLQISPAEQVAFLRKLVNRQLPLSPATYGKVAAVIPTFSADGWTVHGKTGTGDQAGEGKRQYGWFVGWAEKGGRKIAFARLVKDDAKREDIAGIGVRDEFLAAFPGLIRKAPGPATSPSPILR